MDTYGCRAVGVHEMAGDPRYHPSYYTEWLVYSSRSKKVSRLCPPLCTTDYCRCVGRQTTYTYRQVIAVSTVPRHVVDAFTGARVDEGETHILAAGLGVDLIVRKVI